MGVSDSRTETVSYRPFDPWHHGQNIKPHAIHGHHPDSSGQLANPQQAEEPQKAGCSKWMGNI